MSHDEDSIRRAAESLGLDPQTVDEAIKILTGNASGDELVLTKTKKYLNTGVLPKIYEAITNASDPEHEDSLHGLSVDDRLDKLAEIVKDSGYTQEHMLAALGAHAVEMRGVISQAIDALRMWAESDPRVHGPAYNLSMALDHIHSSDVMMDTVLAAYLHSITPFDVEASNAIPADEILGTLPNPPYPDVEDENADSKVKEANPLDGAAAFGSTFG